MRVSCLRAILCVVAFVALGIARQSHAALITDGGFETGGVFPATWSGVGSFDVTSTTKNSGTYSAFLGASSGNSISQTINTTVGASYDLDFFIRSNPGGSATNSFSVMWGATTVFSLSNYNQAFTEFTVNNLVATSATTTLKFNYNGTSAFLAIDDISLAPAAVTTPEPATIAIWFVGAMGAAIAYRRRARWANSA